MQTMVRVCQLLMCINFYVSDQLFQMLLRLSSRGNLAVVAVNIALGSVWLQFRLVLRSAIPRVWMIEWKNECVFIYRTYHIVSQGGLQFYLSEIGRQLVKKKKK